MAIMKQVVCRTRLFRPISILLSVHGHGQDTSRRPPNIHKIHSLISDNHLANSILYVLGHSRFENSSYRQCKVYFLLKYIVGSRISGGTRLIDMDQAWQRGVPQLFNRTIGDCYDCSGDSVCIINAILFVLCSKF
jgi:hypothetical protein